MTTPPPNPATAAPSKTASHDGWSSWPLSRRLAIVKAFREGLAAEVDSLAAAVHGPGRTPAQTIAAEILPLLEAAKFLERNARRLLRRQRLGLRGRPSWLWGVRGSIERRPLGRVLILGTWNYPLFLTGCQLLQALVAGNRVTISPGRGCSPVTLRMARLLAVAGLPGEALDVVGETVGDAQAAMRQADHVILTGSSTTARAVLRQAAETLTSCTIEASGSDAVFVLPGANLRRLADALAFGMQLNGSATCIGPRRVLVLRDQFDLLAATLEAKLAPLRLVPDAAAWDAAVLAASESNGTVPETCGRVFPAIAGDAATAHAQCVSPLLVLDPDRDSPVVTSDLFAPVLSLLPVASVEEMLAADAACPYALGASVFGPEADAVALADRVHAGCITVNDLIVPTADPRIPFGGRGESGYGVTRGGEGLLALTRPHVVMTRRGSWLPHLDEPHPQDAALLGGLAQYGHAATWRARMAGLKRLITAARRLSPTPATPPRDDAAEAR